MIKSPLRTVVLPLALLVALAAPCRADDADKDKPINVAGDTGEFDQANGTGDLSGNVTITQGTIVLHANHVTFKRNPDNSFSATAFGNPVNFRQRREGSDEYDEAYAERIAYNGQSQLVELFVHALLKQGPTKELRSEYIAYNRATGVASAGSPQNASTAEKSASRVTGVIMPKDLNGADKGKDAAAGKDKDTKAPAAKADAKPSPADAAKPAPAADAAKPATAAGTPEAKAPDTKADASKDSAPLPLTIDSDLKSK